MDEESPVVSTRKRVSTRRGRSIVHKNLGKDDQSFLIRKWKSFCHYKYITLKKIVLNTFLRKPLLILIVVCLINLTWSGCSEDNYGAVISANHEALAQILDQVCILTVEGIRACIHICNFVFIDLHVCVQISTFVVIDLGVCVQICTLFCY